MLLTFAMDRSTVRTYDRDGRLHIASAHITKACVSEYLGSEIPGAEEFGLDPNRRYKLLRDPEELQKVAPTFNNIPILSQHIPVNADDHQPDLVIGATGTNAAFSAPFLDNALVIWARAAIDAIEAGTQRQLSAGYSYRCILDRGTFKGEAYDGRMVDIIGNHVATVAEGRVGPDCIVGDAAWRHIDRNADHFYRRFPEARRFAR